MFYEEQLKYIYARKLSIHKTDYLEFKLLWISASFKLYLRLYFHISLYILIYRYCLLDSKRKWSFLNSQKLDGIMVMEMMFVKCIIFKILHYVFKSNSILKFSLPSETGKNNLWDYWLAIISPLKNGTLESWANTKDLCIQWHCSN